MLCDKPFSLMKDGLEMVAACGTCTSCRAVRRRDVIGRALAEARAPSTRHFTFTTLTYGHDNRYSQKVDHPHANKLVYRDIQLWLKRIRKRQIPGTKDKYRVRYMVAGEYGTLKGRAHWHCLLWWQSEPPKYLTVERWSDDPFWSEGFTNWQKANAKCVAYVAKYITKSNIAADTETCFHGSFRPLIGGEFFRQWAELHVNQGLPLNQGRKFQLPDSYTRKGKTFDYWMSPAAARMVARRYVEAWAEKYGTAPPNSSIVEKYLDEEAKHRLSKLRDDAAIERVRVGGYVSEARRRAKEPLHGPPSGYECWFDHHFMAFTAVVGDGRPQLFWNDSSERWSQRLEPRKVGLGDLASPVGGSDDPLPDLPGEAPREFRRTADMPDFVPGEALSLGRRRKSPGVRKRELVERNKYHRAMLDARVQRVAEAIRSFRENDNES